MTYEDFIKSKKTFKEQSGFKMPDSWINNNAFDFQA